MSRRLQQDWGSLGWIEVQSGKVVKPGLLDSDQNVYNPTIDRRSWPRPTSGQRTVTEAASGNSSRPGTGNVEIRLLQLNASRSATNNDCTTATNPECCRSPDDDDDDYQLLFDMTNKK